MYKYNKTVRVRDDVEQPLRVCCQADGIVILDARDQQAVWFDDPFTQADAEEVCAYLNKTPQELETERAQRTKEAIEEMRKEEKTRLKALIAKYRENLNNRDQANTQIVKNTNPAYSKIEHFIYGSPDWEMWKLWARDAVERGKSGKAFLSSVPKIDWPIASVAFNLKIFNNSEEEARKWWKRNGTDVEETNITKEGLAELTFDAGWHAAFKAIQSMATPDTERQKFKKSITQCFFKKDPSDLRVGWPWERIDEMEEADAK